MSFSMRGGASVRGLGNLVWQFRRGILAGGSQVVRIVTDRARQGMTGGPHTGHKYPRLPNRSSAPGEYAANQSGAAMGSIQGTNSLTQIRIGMGAAHAGFIEFGTSRMAPRPPIGNAVRDTLGQVQSVLPNTVWNYIQV